MSRAADVSEEDPANRKLSEGRAVRKRERATVATVVAGLTSAVHLEITGEPGIGKTWMLAEVTRTARGSGYTVLSGGAERSAADVELGPLIDAVDEHAAGLAEALPPQIRAALAEVFPSLPRDTGSPAPAGARRLAHAVRVLLETSTATRPLVLALDDLHLADARTVDLLCQLLRLPPRAPVLFAVAYRPKQASARLRRAFATAPALVRLPLQPLSLDQVRALADDSVSAAQCRELHRHSHGNPRYVAAILDPEGRAADATVVDELDELSANARLTAVAGSVLGDDFDLPEVTVAAGLPEADIYVAVDELVAVDLIRELAEPGRFAFRHPVVRHTIYRNARPGWRLGAQARAGRVPASELPRPRRPGLLTRLTDREQQVARLVGDGMTNREIAAALYVTEKTVEMHLSNVFGKLEVRNRVGVARLLHAESR
ncbi:helix-turn-helix transcriptional regulator [Amycolatopsis mediterranei]|uniref:helix-turn-helix transcriptional regulator n=3 Tax=Amycolatopsis mediterranei TaxID=33910 RepID=UPI0002D90487|nr:LuxR family transcriptional regulator [Amycolatopsis mediterranei]